MLLALFIIMTMVDEPKLMEEQRQYEKAHPEDNLSVTDAHGEERLPASVKKSLAFLLASIALWFIAYNAVETWFTTYASKVWNMPLGGSGGASLCLTIATVGAIVTYIPTGVIAGRIGRKKTIQIGIILITAAFFTGFLFTCFSSTFSPLLYIVFVIVGVGWAMINVNSLPMVVEMCKGSDIGKFTGYYYTFSMAAQTVTPIVAGFLLSHVGYQTLFPYAAVFAFLSFVTMLFVKHGDSRKIARKGLETFDDLDL